MAEGGGSPPTPRESPPKAVIDTSPLHIDQNKESLKVKLMLRRPFDQLVAQGIMPPHKTPAAYHGQRRQLERAKTGDMLKAKIQQRPPRQELERRHILEADPGHVDPSLAERQRMLKKARLADQLNDQLSHRPGPLELIQKNILHTEEPIEQAVKTGRITYKATSEGQLNRPQHPQSYINPEDDSQSSEGDNAGGGAGDVLETAAKSAGIVVSLIPAVEEAVVAAAANPVKDTKSELVFADLCRSVAAPLLNQAASPASSSTLSPLSSVASPVPPPPPPQPTVTAVTPVVLQPVTPTLPVVPPTRSVLQAKSDAPGKDKNRKKSKSKSIPKARTIKFHEYKGPPSAQKNSTNSNAPGESSYDLLLKQQTLLLQFQLQLQHKYPQIILPASQKTAVDGNNSNGSTNNPLPSPAPSTSSESSTAPTRLTGRLEDMKVSDLKAELKRRSLPVSGSKPQLIERLKPYTGNNESSIMNHNSMDSPVSSVEQSHNSPPYQDNGSPQSVNRDDQSEQMDISDPLSPLPQQQQLQDQFHQLQAQQQTTNQDTAANLQRTKDDIVREQQRQIEELQRELTLSQLKLQAATRSEPKAQVIALQKHLQARQQQQQQQQQMALQMQQLQALQARQTQVNEEQQRLQQQQHVAFQNQKNLAGGVLLNGADAALVLNLMQGKAKVINGHSRTHSLPNFLNTLPVIAATTTTTQTPTTTAPDVNSEVKSPPPLYEEATKNNKKNNIKSQIVDDVLEILIKNGELPPSAAHDPSTPGSAGTKLAEPVFPTGPQPMDSNNSDNPLGLDPTEFIDSLDNLDNMDFTQFVMELSGSGDVGGNHVQDDIGGGGVCNNNNNHHHSLNNGQDSIVSPMDTDDWLESLCNSANNNNNDTCTAPLATQEPDLVVGYDPLMGIGQDPFDPFNLEDFRTTADLTASLSWDKVDYAA